MISCTVCAMERGQEQGMERRMVRGVRGVGGFVEGSWRGWGQRGLGLDVGSESGTDDGRVGVGVGVGMERGTESEDEDDEGKYL